MRMCGNRQEEFTMVAQPIAITLPREGHVMMTPELALQWLDAYQLPRQRRLIPYHVKNLAHEVALGELFGGVIIFARTPSGTLYLADAQHRLHAVARAKKAVEFAVIIFDVP